MSQRDERVWWVDLLTEEEMESEFDIVCGALMSEHPRQGPLDWQSRLFKVVPASELEKERDQLNERIKDLENSYRGTLTPETMPFELYCELRGTHGLDVESLLKRSQLELLETLACHCRNRDDWHRKADQLKLELGEAERVIEVGDQEFEFMQKNYGYQGTHPSVALWGSAKEKYLAKRGKA